MGIKYYKVVDEDWSGHSYFYINENGQTIECADSKDAKMWAKANGMSIPEIHLESASNISKGAIRCLVEPILSDGYEDWDKSTQHRVIPIKATSFYNGEKTAEVYMHGDKTLTDSEYWQKRLTRIVAACEVQRLGCYLKSNEAFLFISQAGVESLSTINLDTYEINAIGQIDTKSQMSLFPEITQLPLVFCCDADVHDKTFAAPQIYSGGTRLSTNISVDDEIEIPDNLPFGELKSFLMASAFGLWDSLGQPTFKQAESHRELPSLEQINTEFYPESFRHFDIDKYRESAFEMFDMGINRAVEDCVIRQQSNISTFGIVERKVSDNSKSYDLLILEDGKLSKGSVTEEFAKKLMESLPIYAHIVENVTEDASAGIVIKSMGEEVVLGEVENYEEAYKLYNRAMLTTSILESFGTYDASVIDEAKEFANTIAEGQYLPDENLRAVYSMMEPTAREDDGMEP